MRLTLDRPVPGVSSVRDHIASGLMLVFGALSVYVAVDSLLAMGDVAPNQLAVEVWRALGYLVFAGLFTLVGLFPRRMTGIWELIIFHKVAQIIYLIPHIGTDEGASITKTIGNIVLNDTMLAVVTLVAYVLAKGWKAWRVDR